MTIRPAAVFAAEGVAIDQFTGRLTAFNMLEAILAASTPALLNKLAIVCIYDLESEPTTFFEKIELKDPTQNTVWTSVLHLQLQGRQPGALPVAHRTIHGLWNVRVTAPGDYALEVFHGTAGDGPWELVSRRIMPVLHMAHPLFGAPVPPNPPSQ